MLNNCFFFFVGGGDPVAAAGQSDDIDEVDVEACRCGPTLTFHNLGKTI